MGLNMRAGPYFLRHISGIAAHGSNACPAQSCVPPALAKVHTTSYQAKHCLELDLDSAFVAAGCEGGMRVSFAGFRSLLPFSGLVRQLEQEMETVIKVLQPGPLGIIEHKVSADEINRANATIAKAVANWRRNATLQDQNHILKDHIHK